MPKKSKHELVNGAYFRWRLVLRDGVWYGDGRSDPRRPGRHSLGTKDRQEALEALRQLDEVRAVQLGLIARQERSDAPVSSLALTEGVRLYQKRVALAETLGGASRATQKRYRAVCDKFMAYCEKHGIRDWREVTQNLVVDYLTWLNHTDYAERTIYLEGTTIQQILKFLIEEKLLPGTSAIRLKLHKCEIDSAFCYTDEQVEAMIKHCAAHVELNWLHDIIVLLACTGLRISEASNLRWSDVDMDRNVIEIRNDPAGVKRVRRRTKNRSNRVLPIHTELKAVLSGMKRTADGWVLHGPRGARLKADTVRTCLVRDVIRPLRPRFPSDEGDAGFQAGRLHSFRHYFCSRSANQGIPERVVSNWLGHRDSRMIQRYYHLVNEESQRQMKKLVCILPDAGSVAGAAADAEPGATAATPECA